MASSTFELEANRSCVPNEPNNADAVIDLNRKLRLFIYFCISFVLLEDCFTKNVICIFAEECGRYLSVFRHRLLNKQELHLWYGQQQYYLSLLFLYVHSIFYAFPLCIIGKSDTKTGTRKCAKGQNKLNYRKKNRFWRYYV